DGFPHELVDDRTSPLEHTVGGPTCSPGCAAATQFATDNGKGPMITQSLQGLLNFEVAKGTSLVTNAPYHWRGDKPDFQAFNEAFVGLQGLPDLNDGDPSTEPNAGVTAQEMDQFTEFINSINYPPNPLEPRTRVYEGSLGGLNNLNSLTETGSGTLVGL